MLLHIIARGRIGRGPEAELVERYFTRIAWPTKITELPDRGGKVPPLPPGGVTIMLDEKGKSLGSVAFAEQLGRWRDDGAREARFLIGAADGFDDKERSGADLLGKSNRAQALAFLVEDDGDRSWPGWRELASAIRKFGDLGRP